MNIRNILRCTIVASVLGSLAFPAFAAPGDCKPKDVAITSTRIYVLGPASPPGVEYAVAVNGTCLDQVTNVFVANDLGGFDNVNFSLGSPPTSLVLGSIVRPESAGGVPIPVPSSGQYLLRLMQCKIPATAEKCKVLDEMFQNFIPQPDII